MLIECRAVEPFMKNGYLIGCEETGEAAYVDPGDEVNEILSFIDGKGLELTHILNTHGHMDHICGVGRVKQKWDVPIYIHPADEFLYDSLQEQGHWFGMSYSPAPPAEVRFDPGTPIRVGNLSINVHHTPGHSPGHVTLEAGDNLFCGDVIFAGAIGRTDLPGGNHATLMDTIHHRIVPLGNHKTLHPGHGPATTIAQELRTNPFLTR
jgi:glyoxylase-like metal-dependent hydrolase (beta-lactamase superfamily II)